MITFNTQEEFDAAVMAAVERYLQIKLTLDYTPESTWSHAQIGATVRLIATLSQTEFSADDTSVSVMP